MQAGALSHATHSDWEIQEENSPCRAGQKMGSGLRKGWGKVLKDPEGWVEVLWEGTQPRLQFPCYLHSDSSKTAGRHPIRGREATLALFLPTVKALLEIEGCSQCPQPWTSTPDLLNNENEILLHCHRGLWEVNGFYWPVERSIEPVKNCHERFFITGAVRVCLASWPTMAGRGR